MKGFFYIKISMQTKYNITILWGTDWFWKWLCEYALKHFSEYINLTITGRKKERWEALAQELWVVFTDNNIDAVKNADIVIYSVPIAYTQQVIEDTIDHVKSWAIIADVTSIKKFPSNAMNRRDDLIVIPTHPMFGPYISSIAGQVIVLTPEEKVKKHAAFEFLVEHLKSQKARVIQATPQYHDKMMAVVQWLTHFNMFVVGETMKRLKFNIADSMDFVSPIYKLMISSVWRYLWQNPWLYADIQMYNDEILDVHEKFLDTAKNFHTSVKDKDYDKFCSDIIAAKEFLWEENCNEGQEYTDKVIYLLWKQIDILKNNIWKRVRLKNIYSWESIEGLLEGYKNWEIFFPEGNIYKLDRYEVETI